MESAKDWLSNLKLRASWGKLGNTTAGYYDWQATYSTTNYSFGGDVIKGLRQSKIANPELHWEASESVDVGLEMGFFNNRLGIEADWYQRTTKGILASPSIYMTMGSISAPVTNTSDMRNRGIEFTLRGGIPPFLRLVGGCVWRWSRPIIARLVSIQAEETATLPGGVGWRVCTTRDRHLCDERHRHSERSQPHEWQIWGEAGIAAAAMGVNAAGDD